MGQRSTVFHNCLSRASRAAAAGGMVYARAPGYPASWSASGVGQWRRLLFFDFSFREGERFCARVAIFYDYGAVGVLLMAAGGHVLPL